jgi:hypothetical protein
MQTFTVDHTAFFGSARFENIREPAQKQTPVALGEGLSCKRTQISDNAGYVDRGKTLRAQVFGDCSRSCRFVLQINLPLNTFVGASACVIGYLANACRWTTQREKRRVSERRVEYCGLIIGNAVEVGCANPFFSGSLTQPCGFAFSRNDPRAPNISSAHSFLQERVGFRAYGFPHGVSVLRGL